MKSTRLLALAVAAVLTGSLAACSSSGNDAGGNTTVNWWTWDPVQAEAYQQCVPDFQAKNPGVTVKISQYNTDDYFTKLTAGFVGGNAPDGFMNSVQYFPSYVDQGQLEPLDDHVSKDGFDLKGITIGTDAWKGKDGKLYGLPMDWATSGIYYNKALLEKGGVSEAQLQSMTFDPSDGGTVEKIAEHLTVDRNGVRGDAPGFDKAHVAVYGIGMLAANDFRGQTSWFPFAAATGWTKDKPESWPTEFSYNDPRFVSTMRWIKTMIDKGYSPKLGTFTVSDSEQLGSGKVAMTVGGSWEAATFAKLPGLKAGIAPSPLGKDGKTRGAFGNANGNVVWAKSKNKEATWKWIAYQESGACQTKAATYNASFFPSNGKAMDALVTSEKAKGVDLSVFTAMEKAGQIQLSKPFNNGTNVQSTLQPLFEQYFTTSAGDDFWSKVTDKSKETLAAQG
ncbi:MAG TPA: sugar ABC transporter substrate-binding protein [Kribbella sp.]|nr:sugar ABC transporter substrate-binding protein [Kribbella sp.]